MNDVIADILDQQTSQRATDTSVKTEDQNSSNQQQAQLNNEKIEEQKQRRKFRLVMFWCFFSLLLIQHILLACFIICSIANNFINNIQPLLAIIIPATLGETYFIMRQMVQFVFTSGDFTIKKIEQ